MVAVELEVLAKKFDRFGWQRDAGTMAHDRMILDWMDALQDYPLGEVKAACRAAVLERPGTMPNEGHILAKIRSARAQFLAARPRIVQPSQPEPERISAERAAEIMREAGWRPKQFPKTGEGAA
jgi:hypothetical protein